MIAFGVFLGMENPRDEPLVKLYPNSLKVGTSGRNGERLSVMIARARSLPARSWG